MTQREAVEKLINTAWAEVGYHETGVNVTKYAADLDAITGFYNGKKQGVAWCDMFVDWCFIQTFGAEIGRKMLYQPLKSAGAGCASSAKYYKRNNAFFHEPAIGDQVFFGPEGAETHTGIVVTCDASSITTIEGNASDQVKRLSYKKTNGRISGYGRPNWALITADKGVKQMLYEATVTSINGKGVYMRKAARKNAAILNTLPVGTKVEVLAEVDDDWCEIRQAGTDGYMMRMYLKRENGQNGSAQETISHIRALLDTLEQQIGGA